MLISLVRLGYVESEWNGAARVGDFGKNRKSIKIP